MPAGDVQEIEKLHQHIVALAGVVDDLSSDELAPALGALQQCVNSLAEVHRRLLAAVVRRDVWAFDGYRSASPWIAFHTGLPVGRARRLGQQATTMQQLEHARAAALEGVLNDTHVESITACHRSAPHRFDAHVDDVFTTVAASGDLDGFRQVVRAWQAQLDAQEGPDPAEVVPGPERESLRLGESFQGWWHGEFRLSPANGARLHELLERGAGRYLQARRDGDPSLEQLDLPAVRAQVLMDLIDAGTRRDPRAATAPDRYHVAFSLHTDEHGHVAPVEPTHPGVTCDATLFRMVMGAAGQPLDIGRATRSWSPAMRAAIVLRDAHCRFPGCTEPPGHCDVHHCTPWEHGGHTAVTNGILLCRWHHTFLHTRHWTVQLNDCQHPTFRQPDGTPHHLHSKRPTTPSHDPP